MRLIIKDYLMLLKEKDELDILICDLLLQMGYSSDSRPKTGNRQYGVDIRAHNSHEMLLLVVKQGNISRHTWDSGPNSVRQSLDEIRDVYYRIIKSELNNKGLRIIVVTNGILEEAVSSNFYGYASNNTMWDDVPVKIEFWGIDDLVDSVEKYLLNEAVFNEKMRGQMRKALYYIGESDYDGRYYESIINTYINSIDCESKNRAIEKHLAGLFLANQMIANYAAEAQIYKIAISVTEYIIIKFWQFLNINNLFEKEMYVSWLQKFLRAYDKWNDSYYKSTKYCAGGPGRFPSYNSVEQRVLLYEVMGFWASYAYRLSITAVADAKAENRCFEVCTSIICLFNYYPQIFYPPYDCHAGTLSIVIRLLLRMGRVSDANSIIEKLCYTEMNNYLKCKKYPDPDDNFRTAVQIDLDLNVSEYNCSAFWGNMIEWIIVLEKAECYEKVFDFLTKDLNNVSKCIWFLRQSEETLFYDCCAMYNAGEGTTIELGNTFEETVQTVKFILDQYKEETFSFEEYSFKELEMITCRYYGYFPRVINESVSDSENEET